ncbi:hypothetical protein AVEN_175190-1 [Araneus ventricosus]|uniref:Reverse transcriptase domain-containing protein n=1 Tax=Araneus ventricosus TaxID=182803 RepID=A0A4Y2HH62_ARAVE|nr:hypothetical protein AVEN_175190-1 [Araneus ventricosus]
MIEFLRKNTQNNLMGVIKNILKDTKLDVKTTLIVQDNGKLSRDFADSRDYVLKEHFIMVEEDMRVEGYRNRDDDIKDFTIEEIETCIKSFKKKSAPGFDGWSIDFIIKIYISDKEWFKMILNLCFNLGIFTRRWKIAEVILIPKDGKDSLNYRS